MTVLEESILDSSGVPFWVGARVFNNCPDMDGYKKEGVVAMITFHHESSPSIVLRYDDGGNAFLSPSMVSVIEP